MQRFEFAKSPKTTVTKEEAAAMIELWTREAEAQNAGAIDLRDVAEVLHISEGQAGVLLSRVRGETPSRKTALHPLLRLALLTLLAPTLVYSTAAIYVLLADLFKGRPFEPLDLAGLLIALAWTVGWFRYLRRAFAPRLAALSRHGVIRGN
jgi:hypothetical protein